ncbi:MULTISPECIES: LLM class flavin-dependent oxidoreductase [unclassified Facklamia]|uniref:LLM class flavin-dependent oxidoreductase n=1 Tax=Aerococcaceae TaxID=186827 RepID=UPI0013B8E1C8|nr:MULTISPECIES: LLM class flavin-dependent oxidoreductase [unclassified Facklamia]NEW63711.1 MsnO8 family LLM class oxidoreductase [Facklamia sp. 252]NEW67182.1 MsnO8 family LLM class oxidoreductase [Facklamia sp. 253]QQD66278.1 LLM class flavin-dependent oxidoreductase [Aerococcaceae bacterium zg-252]
MQISILNLAPLRQGESFRDAMNSLVRLAQVAEKLGYERYWIAEHHNTSTVASSATQLLIQHTLANTQTIRVGSGGVMLPNHSPYLVAEQYGTIETLYPNRLDLGLGRAPGTDLETARAIRRTNNLHTNFPDEIAELQGYFDDTNPVHAYPAAGLSIPFYILGSSLESARLAARLGLPYSFAAHFAPAMMEEAVALYRKLFKPSDKLSEPYVILGANAVVADTDEEAERLATTQTQSFLGLITGESKGLQPPLENNDAVWRDYVKVNVVPHFGPMAFKRDDLINRERSVIENMTKISFVGSPESVSRQIDALKERVHFDELMINSYIYDEKAQHYSYQLLAEIVKNK